VESVQTEQIYQAQLTPTIPIIRARVPGGKPNDDLYGLKKASSTAAWNCRPAREIIVAVVDTGIDYNHPDWARQCVDESR